MVLMRDKRAIIIKSPRLQKIRNSLRKMLLEAVSVKWNEINDEWREFFFNPDGTRRSIRNLPPDELEKFHQLQDQQSELRMLADRSICKCIACRKPDRDMVYNKAYDAWYCTECYGLHRAHAKELAEKAKEGVRAKPQGHEEKAIDELYKTFL